MGQLWSGKLSTSKSRYSPSSLPANVRSVHSFLWWLWKAISIRSESKDHAGHVRWTGNHGPVWRTVPSVFALWDQAWNRMNWMIMDFKNNNQTVYVLSGTFFFAFLHLLVLRFDAFQFTFFLGDGFVQALQLLFSSFFRLIVTLHFIAEILECKGE